MQKKTIFLVVISMLTGASVALAHDHGGMQDGSHHAVAKDEQSAKETADILEKCEQQVTSIHRRISRLQSELASKNAPNAINDELKKLELKLNEAGDIVRPLQIF